MSGIDRSNLRFKAVYYSITLACLGIAALALYKAHSNLHIRQLFWACLCAVVLSYILIAFLIIRKKHGFTKFLYHTVSLQLIPVCAAILVFWFVSGLDTYSPASGSSNKFEVTFNDLQKEQKKAAEKNGLPPFESREALQKAYRGLCKSDKLVKISTNSGYIVRKLTHSVPYVVPKVEELLDDIADSFQEKTKSKAKFVVTSVLRTEEDVARLQKVNANATSASCHCNATTIDISYVSFGHDRRKKRKDNDLRLALAESIYELREAGRCLVKIEKKQHCYHITVR